jgi:hypothetical protein
MLEQDFKKFIGDSAHPQKSSSMGGYKFLHKPLIHYELRILSALNFQTMVPLVYIVPHMESILSIIDTNLQDQIGEESYQDFMSQRGVQWLTNGRKILPGDMEYEK